MKTLSFKVLGCAAALALLTVAQAQVPDNGNGQTPGNPPPDNSAPPDVTSPGQNGSQPNVIVVPMPVEMMDTNNPDMNGSTPPAGVVVAPDQSQPQPMQRQPSQNFNQNQGRFDRRQRGNRDSRQQRLYNNNTGDASAYMPPANASTNGADELYLNFHGAPIDEVLNYLSDAAGFIIELDTRVSGTVDVWSAHPVTRDEAVELLNSVLNRNGYAAVRSGRTLRIMSHDDAIHSEIPVKIGSDPESIPSDDEIVTQIIPIRFVQARQLITDLSPLISSRATIIANDAGNSIIVTDTQANIRHLAEIVKAIDSSAEDVTEVKVFHLQYHDPTEVANLLSQVFNDQTGQGNTQALPIRFGGGPFGGFGGGGGGFRRFFGGGGGPGGQQNGNSQNDRLRQRPHVVAVADERTGSVLVTAPKDLMDEIGQMIGQLDQESPKVAHVSVVHLENADPQQVLKTLQDFQANNNRNSSQNSQSSPLMQRENQSSIYNSSSSGFGTSGGIGGNGFGGGGGFGFRGGGQ